MNCAIRGLTALAVLVSSTSSLWAGSCGYVSSYAPSYYVPSYTPTYVEHKTIVNKITVLDFTPPYAVGYALPYVAPAVVAPSAVPSAAMPAPCAAATTACEERVAGLRAELAEFKARFNAALAPAAPAPAAAPAPPAPPPMAPVNGAGAAPAAAPAGKSVAVGKCASCHDSTTAAAKGKGVILTQNGALLALTPELAQKSMREAMSGKMPKGGPPLSDQEFTILLNELLSIPAK